MSRWFALAAAIPLACAAAEPDLALDVRLDPATREFSAVAELARAPADFRFVPHKSLSVRSANRLTSGKLRIEYGGVLPALERSIDFRGVLRVLPPMASPEGTYLGSASGWYPQPAELFTYRVRLSLKGRQRGLVAGKLLPPALTPPPPSRGAGSRRRAPRPSSAARRGGPGSRLRAPGG